MLAEPRALSGSGVVLNGMLDKGVASFLVSIGFDGRAAGLGAGGVSSELRCLLNILTIAALLGIKNHRCNPADLLVYRGIVKKGKLPYGYEAGMLIWCNLNSHRFTSGHPRPDHSPQMPRGAGHPSRVRACRFRKNKRP